jgi:phosphatidylserine/phosphatidylglycerophosphate/cardiolipin synthase-like enzyme
MELLSRDESRGTHAVKLVATAPISTPELATTRDTVLDLVATAQRDLLVLGFGLTDDGLYEALVGAAGRGVAIMIVGERSRDDLLAFARRWPATVPTALFLQMVEPPAGESSIMHAKVVVADQLRVLIGSANFTSGGMNNNFELGLRVDGPVATSIVRLVSSLLERHWLEPLQL